MRGIGAAQFGAFIAGMVPRRVRMGADPLPWLDPATPSNELPDYIDAHPEALENPSMPADVLLFSAAMWPEYVENNPVLSMISVLDPTLYEELQEMLVDGWASAQEILKLSSVNQRKLGFAFARRFWPSWQKKATKAQYKITTSALDEAEKVFYAKVGSFDAYEIALGACQLLLAQTKPRLANNDKNILYQVLRAVVDATSGLGPGAGVNMSSHVGESIRQALYCYFVSEGKEPAQAFALSSKERLHQAQEVRRVFLEEETFKEINRQLGNKFREAFYGEEADKEKKPKAPKKKTAKDYLREYEREEQEYRFIEKNKAAAKQIARKIAETRGAGWAPYLLLGVVAGAIAIVIAGELLATAAVIEGGSLAADAIAGEIAAYAAAADVSTISVEQLLTAAEMNEVEAQLFYKELKDRLLSRGLDVVKDAAQAVVQVTR